MRVKSTNYKHPISRRTSIQTLLLLVSQGLYARGHAWDEPGGESRATLFGGDLGMAGEAGSFGSARHAFFAGTKPVQGITTFDDAVDPNAFNTSAALIGATPSPVTVADVGNPSLYSGVGIKATGWDFTITASSGNVTASFSGGGQSGGASDYCIRTNRSLAGQTLVSLGVKSNDASLFQLLSVYIKMNMVPNNSSSLSDVTITGYKSGAAVAGATLTITGIPRQTWQQFDVSANTHFIGIDEFRFTTAPGSGVVVNSLFVDQIVLPTTPLPLTLLTFSGYRAENDALLQWETGMEENASRFQVERAVAGGVFMAIGSVPAAGNSNLPTTYHYTDVHAFANPASAGGYLYRLKMIDLDERSTYSPVLRIGASTSDLPISAWPNPFQQQLSIFVQSPEADAAQIIIRDMSGRQIEVLQMSLQRGGNVLTLHSLGHLDKGTYLVTVATRTQRQTLNVVKIP